MAGKYDDLSREQLLRLLEKRDRERKFGLVWERDEIEADHAVDENFVAATLDAALSERSAPWENLVIEGDNFDALRWLRMAYAGRVKCIYIDPPYNTGNKDWVYNDHYMDPTDSYRHSTWLEFLYRRLTLARDLLSEDGVLLVSINDENRAKLEMLMDEALPGMRVGSLVWRTRNGSNADQVAFLSQDHEHVLVYANPSFSFCGTGKSYDAYDNPDADVRGEWQAVSLKLGFSYRERPNLFYPLKDPKTNIFYPPSPDRVWVYASENRLKAGQTLQTKPMEKFIADNQVLFPAEQRVECYDSLESLYAAIDAEDVPKSGGVPVLRRGLPGIEEWVGRRIGFGTPRRKLFISELRRTTQPLSSWIVWRSTSDLDGHIVAGSNTEGARVLREIFGEKSFNFAKPVSLIRELVRQSTGPGDIVLDFFAGSATTAQAVMELNAEDGGGRRSIMASSTERTEAEPDKNLCRDVTAERIRRLNRMDEGKYAELSAGFAYLRTREIDFSDLDYDLAPQEVWSTLEAMHNLPLTIYDPKLPFNAHEGDSVTLAFADRPEDAFKAYAEALGTSQPSFLYVWAPGALRDWALAETVEVRSVRDTLKQRFQQ